MKYISLYFSLFMLQPGVSSSQESLPGDSAKQPLLYAEHMPEFPGGQSELLKFLSKNIRYPLAARENGIQGKVVVQFVVNDIGRISDCIILRDIGGGCAEEVLRVVKMMPPWKPGTQNDLPVNVYYKMPVSFMLGENNADQDAQFIGGDILFQSYYYKHLKYPKEAAENNISGDLLVNVQIDSKGKMVSYSFDNSLGYGCENAAAKVLRSIRHWSPAYKDGKPVGGSCRLKFTFPPPR